MRSLLSGRYFVSASADGTWCFGDIASAQYYKQVGGRLRMYLSRSQSRSGWCEAESRA